jgi:hypothetical protein
MQPHSTTQRKRKHVPLNRQGVTDAEIDSSICKSLHQDIMKFSTKLNPIYGWKAQLEDVQNCLQDHVVDGYDFKCPILLSETWLLSQVSDGIGCHKFLLQILGGDRRSPLR